MGMRYTHFFRTSFIAGFYFKRSGENCRKSKIPGRLIRASLEAVGKGFAGLQNATMGIGDGYSLINCNRDVQLEDAGG